MDFYTIFSVVAQLLSHRQWKLQRCRRQADDALRYFVTDAGNKVLTPTTHRFSGFTLHELLLLLEEHGDSALADSVRSIRNQIQDAW